MTQAPERDAERVEDAELHARLFPEQTVEWRGITSAGPVCQTGEPCVFDHRGEEPAFRRDIFWEVVPRYGDEDDWSGMRAVIAAMRERGFHYSLMSETAGAIATFYEPWSDAYEGNRPHERRAPTAPQAVRAAARAALEREAL